MATINNVNFDDVAKEALAAAKGIAMENWKSINDILQNIAQSLINDVEFIAAKKATGEFNEDDARAWLDDQKMVARLRLRSLAIIGLQTAENIWNAMAGVFSKAINDALGWKIL